MISDHEPTQSHTASRSSSATLWDPIREMGILENRLERPKPKTIEVKVR